MATTEAYSAIRLLWALDAREVIARRIVQQRERLGLTQQGVAERAKIALRSYQRYETGTVMPRKHAREKVALALELPQDALEPPAAPQSPEEVGVTAAQLQEILDRLARIEAAVGSDTETAGDDEAARKQAAKEEAVRVAEEGARRRQQRRGNQPGAGGARRRAAGDR